MLHKTPHTCATMLWGIFCSKTGSHYLQYLSQNKTKTNIPLYTFGHFIIVQLRAQKLERSTYMCLAAFRNTTLLCIHGDRVMDLANQNQMYFIGHEYRPADEREPEQNLEQSS